MPCDVLASKSKGLGKEGWPRGVPNPIAGCQLGKTSLSKCTALKNAIWLKITVFSLINLMVRSYLVLIQKYN